ncbi:rhodanese-like domain-containing protein [Chlamydiota bacterium]
MKSLIMCLLMLAPLGVFAVENQPTQQLSEDVVSTDMLKSWYDQKKPMTVVDARTKVNFDGSTLPGAKWIPYDSPQETFSQNLPSKDALIVVYCCGEQCPAGQRCAHKLRAMGYTNVYEYKDGIQDWAKRGYPVDHQKS